MRLRIIAVLAGMIIGQLSYAQVKTRTYIYDQNAVPREHALDFRHLALEVSFIPEMAKVVGKVKHHFTVLASETDSVYLDGPGIVLSASKLDGSGIKYRTESDGIILYFGKTLKSGENHVIELDYTASPRKGIYFIGWNDKTGRSRKQIWTQGQGIDNRHWIPMYDLPNDKVTSEVVVTIDSKYRVLSNGQLLSTKKNKNGESVWHYKMKKPHATYLIMLGIGEYEVRQSKSPSGVPMNFWYYPDWSGRVDATYKYSEDMMRFMEEETGLPYPWETYSQIPVQDFIYGAMENTSATVFGDFNFVDERTFLDRNYVRINAHELAHQWFGDYITARTSAHNWLQESFATHYDLMYQEAAFGRNSFDWARRNSALAALAASESDTRPVAHSEAGTARHYPKGSLVLQMLRDVAGNENFKKAINHYLTTHALGNVNSDDLLVAFHESTGLSLDWFWEEWVYKGGEPHYRVSFEVVQKNGKDYGRFVVDQVNDVTELTSLFRMPVNFEIRLKDETRIVQKRWVEERNHIYDFELPKGSAVSFALFDAGCRILKKVDFEKPVAMLLAQAQKADGMLDRYDAVKALESTAMSEKAEVLRAIFNSADFHAVRCEALRQFYNDPQSRDLVASAFGDAETEVRRTVLQLHPGIRPEFISGYEKLLSDPSYAITEGALERLCSYYAGRPEASDYLDMTKDIEGDNERNVRIAWHQFNYLERRDQKSIESLIDYTSPAFEFRTRIEAAQRLKALLYLNEKLLLNLLDGHFSYNPRLRSPMKEILDFYGNSVEGKKLMNKVIAEGTWNDWQQKRLNLLLK